ncbi:B- and T-lymphocyte attenuator-like [Cololabis saira]|uniref:B- and T-lymphocyte attenuator-like n=1 Tax=Cololabis saira TaxID=129043 RepID=UPI002AD2A40D|nr:B- and T-lymphocyte attenuator-like [Cololabis saira]
MKHKNCSFIFHLLISALVIFNLDADTGEDSDCFSEIKVSRNTKYEAVLGEDFRIACPVAFCNAAPPEVRWYKGVHEDLRAINRSDGHTEVEWEPEKEFAGKSYLIFRNIQKNDEGYYRCRIPGSISHNINVNVNGSVKMVHNINVSVNGDTELTTAPALTPESHTQSVFWHYMHRVIGILAFFTVVIIICVTSHLLRKGKSQNTAAPSLGPSDPIYENEPVASVSAQLGPS